VKEQGINNLPKNVKKCVKNQRGEKKEIDNLPKNGRNHILGGDTGLLIHHLRGLLVLNECNFSTIFPSHVISQMNFTIFCSQFPG
jgi:hypothetical protein